MTQGQTKLKALLDHLNLKIPTLAKMLGFERQRLYDIKSGKTERISLEVATRINEVFPEISVDWLLDEEDSPVRKSYTEEGNPYFDDFTIQGGSGHGDGEEEAITPTGYMGVPGIQKSPDIPFFKVRGNSMLNAADPDHSIPNGSWIALKRVQSTAIRWGEVYAFQTVDGPIVKKIMPSEREGCVKCVSYNKEEYPPFDLPVSDIIENSFCLVMGVVGVQVWH